MHPLTDAPRTPLAAAIVADAVQRIEATGPLDDAALLSEVYASQPTRAAQVLERAWLLGQRLGLPAELARWRRLGWAVLLGLAVLMAASGLALARAVLGEGRSINAVAALLSLLGLPTVTLALWGLALLLPRRAWGGPALGRLALWLTARLPLERGPHALTLLQAATAVLLRQRLLAWLTGAISHTVWALALALTLGVLGFGFAFHAYALSWESTILGAGFFQRFVRLSGALPALLGFPVPDAGSVQSVGNAAGSAAGAAADQRAWAWWLMGCVAVYGLLPRALLALWCLLRWRLGTRRLAGQVDLADPYVRRLLARLDALAPAPAVIDPERPGPAAPAAPLPAAAPGAPGSLAVLGFELPPELPWPLPGLPAGTQPPERIAGSARERQAALQRLAATRPESLLLVVHGPSSPDRGTARFVREAARCARRVALLAWGEGGAARWRAWLDAEGFGALARVESAPEAIDWIANRGATPDA